MSKVEKINKYIELFDIYKNTLTLTQRTIFELYYFNDLSLAEIASERDITRAAVSDSIKKVEKQLLSLESKIGFSEYQKKVNNGTV